MINNIQEHNEYLKLLMNNISSGVALFYFNGDILVLVDLNKKLRSILKISKNEEIENQLSKLINKEILNEKNLSSIKILKEINKNQILDISISRLKLDKKQFYLTSIKDITNEEIEKRQIEENKDKYENLYKRNVNGLFTLDLDGQLLEKNPAFDYIFKKNMIYLFTEEEWKFFKKEWIKKGNIENYEKSYFEEKGEEIQVVFQLYYHEEYKKIEGSVRNITTEKLQNKAVVESEIKYRSIYEESNDIIILLDDDRIIDCNAKGKNTLFNGKRELIEKSLWDLTANQNPEKQKEYKSIFSKLYKEKQIKFAWQFLANEKTIETNVSIKEIKINNETFYQCIIIDETDLNNYLKQVEKSKETLETIIESIPEGLVIFSENDKLLFTNDQFLTLFQLSKDEDIKIDSRLFGKSLKSFQNLYNKHKTEKSNIQSQLSVFIKNVQKDIEISLINIQFEKQNASLLIFKDISLQNNLAKETLRAELAEESNKILEKEINERKKAELQLEEALIRSKSIFESSEQTLLLTLDNEMFISSFNSQSKAYFEEQTGEKLSEGILFDDYFYKIMTPNKLRFFKYLLSSLRKGKSHALELKTVNIQNEKRWLEVYLSPIFNVKGDFIEISIVAHDITDKKQNERAILSSLKEKEVLLKEVHHRVKNNLQIISSILNLQSSYVDNPKALEIIEESRHRIRSMAIIHESLYQNDNFSSINFKNYARELLRNLIYSYHYQKQVEITIEEDIENVFLTLDQAIPCGLIINEIVTNSMKYAFINRKKGKIILNIKEKKDLINITIGDNGVGLPKDFDVEKAESLGIQLVLTLVEQLNGKIITKNGKGLKYFITFDKQKI